MVTTRCCAFWSDLEKEYKWKGGQKGLSTRYRPPQVASWITAGRGGVGPTLSDIGGYDESWWKWWAGLQPAWRVLDAERAGRFQREVYPEGGGEENWQTLRFPGNNGALSLVASLYWWGKRMDEKQQSWEEAVTDVTWVLAGLVEAEKIRGGGRV
ncbi:hypothetical protein R3P38DRAFT_2580004 [Favolaschia claudopus]|uniref:Uncharacterized protein n=1 Tax=Favolaschia claudopus TaxID=2862362 RepID=A0AAV9ZBS7_9AGAR